MKQAMPIVKVGPKMWKRTANANYRRSASSVAVSRAVDRTKRI